MVVRHERRRKKRSRRWNSPSLSPLLHLLRQISRSLIFSRWRGAKIMKKPMNRSEWRRRLPFAPLQSVQRRRPKQKLDDFSLRRSLRRSLSLREFSPHRRRAVRPLSRRRLLLLLSGRCRRCSLPPLLCAALSASSAVCRGVALGLSLSLFSRIRHSKSHRETADFFS